MATHFSVPSTFPRGSIASDQTDDYANQDNLSMYSHASSTEIRDQVPPPPSHSRKTRVHPSGHSIRNDYMRATGNSLELPRQRRKTNKRPSDTQASQKNVRRSYNTFGLQDAVHRPLSPASSHSSHMDSDIPDTDDASGIPRTVDIFPTAGPYRQPSRNSNNNNNDDDDGEPLFVTPSPTMRPQPNHNDMHRPHQPGFPPLPSSPPSNTTPANNNNANGGASDPYAHPDDNPSHRARLRAMAANPGAHPYVRKHAPENDAENREIKRLRTRERLHWDEIADRLNARRVAAGKTPSFTVAAVYGRFARVAPRIAELDGEAGFDYRDFLNFRHERRVGGAAGKRRRREPPMPVLGEGEEAMLAECYEEVERERWENVAKKFKVKAGLWLTPAQVARRWKNL
ncbi:hypothetical protein SLS58_001425 [Diplodia intermedia]|uniref:Myb-like domain-containing protein n=1 Tax=Diplodia intermedia TaxID=856260 RepID=A0ABR3U2S5_9PEZI